MKNLITKIEKKHKELLALKPKFSKELESNLYNWFRVALTYTSNAIEGNTLTHVETAQVIEKDITVKGKSLTEHLEAINHAEAIDFANELSHIKTAKEIQLNDILDLHKFILKRIDDNNAGLLRKVPVRILGSNLPVPNYLKVPDLMNDLINWLHDSKDSIVKIAADAHLKLVFVHPFVDGNRRTARLLMNLLLLQEQYPLVFIKVEDRLKYIHSIQKAIEYVSKNFTNDDFVLNSNSLEIKEFEDYYKIVFEAIEFSLDEYIKAAKESAD